MLMNQNAVTVVLLTLTYFDSSCLGYNLLPHSNKSLLRQKRQINCGSTQFACISGGECVVFKKVCDGRRHCSDGSDESYGCKYVPCPDNAFRCKYGACVDSNFKCNGQKECADGSDEDSVICGSGAMPPTMSTKFACTAGDEYLNFNKVCDGRRDCTDGSDESYGCKYVSCPDNAFRCKYGACVDSNFKCNGQKECADGSDEDPAICGSGAIPPPTNGGCPAINVDNGQYQVLGQHGQGYVVGSPIPNYSFVKITCNKYYELYPDNPLVSCVDGNWSIPVPQCKMINGSCPAVNIDNGQTMVLGGGYVPGSPIPNYYLVKFTCNTNYSLYPDNPLSHCIDGYWNVPVPQCKPTCPPRISSSVDVTCTVDGKPVDCTKPLVDGTVAVGKCKHFYTQVQDIIPISRCSGGSWDVPLIRCEPECGEVIPKGATNVIAVNAQNAGKGEFPWHVAIYRKKTEKYEYQCGGSIITALIILTAAHCFTDELGTERYPAEEYYVAAGKYYSDYNAADDKLAQKSQMKEYHIPPGYRGYQSNFAGDLALGVLKKQFQITNVVQPVCVDWNNALESQQLKSNNRGSVVGWGYVDPNKQQASEELKLLNVPFIDVEDCLDSVPANFRRWVTPDKFCAGFTNGSSVCKGDSGGGMVFDWKENNRQKHYIRGLVSTGPVQKGVCDNFQYGVYTRISFYKDFILNIVAANSVTD